MRNFAAFLGATFLAVACLLMSHGLLSRKDHPVASVSQVAKQSDISEEVKLHLIKSSFRVVTPTGSGTGFAVYSGRRKAETGDLKHYNYVITCAHVVKSFESVNVEQFHYMGNQRIFASTSFSANVVLIDTNHDLALLEVPTDEPFKDLVSFVTPQELKKMKLGLPVWVVGCGLSEPPYVSSGGYVSNFNQNGQLRLTSPIIFGNSGGGAYTSEGKLLGVCRAIPMVYGNAYPNNGYCVPVWTVDIWLKVNGFGFVNGANDNSSLDRIFEIREKAENEAFKIMSERALKKMLDDLLKKMTPPEPEPSPDDHNSLPNNNKKGELFRHKHREGPKERKWLFRQTK